MWCANSVSSSTQLASILGFKSLEANSPTLIMKLFANRRGCVMKSSGAMIISRSIWVVSASSWGIWCFSTRDAVKFWCMNRRAIFQWGSFPCMRRILSPPYTICSMILDRGRLLVTALFLSISSFTNRRSVMTIVVLEATLIEYMGPCCLAHSSNLDFWSEQLQATLQGRSTHLR